MKPIYKVVTIHYKDQSTGSAKSKNVSVNSIDLGHNKTEKVVAIAQAASLPIMNLIAYKERL